MAALISGLGVHFMIGSINAGNIVDRFDEGHRRVEVSPHETEASKARQVALSHINEGTKTIYDRILARVKTESSIGRFKFTYSLRSNESHLKDNVIEKLRKEGFIVSVGTPTQREPETVLNISW